MQKCNAFTFIEILISMAILVILASIATASYKHILSQQALVASTQQLYQFLTLAKSHAIKNNQQIYVHFCQQGSSQIWRMAQSTDAYCDCFESNKSSSNFCSINGEQFNQPLTDGNFVLVSEINFGGRTLPAAQYTSYNTMRFSTDNGHLTLTDSDNEHALTVMQSKVRLRICADGSDQLGYPAC